MSELFDDDNSSNVLSLSTSFPAGSSTSTADPCKRKKQQQPRQLLSCSKCRERKVKCDRTKPCSACCARGHPRECQFTLSEGTAFGPIQQSLELRRLRAENQKLKEQLWQAKIPVPGDNDDEGSLPGHGVTGLRANQRRFGAEEPMESLYFGTPGFASIVEDFADSHVEPKNLTHTMPRGVDMYLTENIGLHPFPTLWTPDSWVDGLRRCFDPWDETAASLDALSARAETSPWPHLPRGVNRVEVGHFLNDFEHNATSYPDMLALILAALAIGTQKLGYGVNERPLGTGDMESTNPKGDLFIATSMQALRQASFLCHPTMLTVEALVLMGRYLDNDGRFMDAWTLFGLTIRSAQSIGLHRNPRYLNPIPSSSACSFRQHLWWWILHMDQHYSMTLGRPLGISGIGDCPFPEPTSTDPALLRLSKCLDHFTVLGRQILGSAQLNDVRVDMLSDNLLKLLDNLPDELQFDESWIAEPPQEPETPLYEGTVVLHCLIQSYLILLNRTRIENARAAARWDIASQKTPSPSRTEFPTLDGQTIMRGRPQVIKSCVALLHGFEYIYRHLPGFLQEWIIGQQACNAAMILLLDMQGTGDITHIECVETALCIFRELRERGIHKLARSAESKISYEYIRLKNALRIESQSPSVHHHLAVMSGGGRRESQLHLNDSHLYSGLCVQAPSDQEQGDTVMGNTGMFLLEEPGLPATSRSSFISEADNSVYLHTPTSVQHSSLSLGVQMPSAPATSFSGTERPHNTRQAKGTSTYSKVQPHSLTVQSDDPQRSPIDSVQGGHVQYSQTRHMSIARANQRREATMETIGMQRVRHHSHSHSSISRQAQSVQSPIHTRHQQQKPFWHTAE